MINLQQFFEWFNNNLPDNVNFCTENFNARSWLKDYHITWPGNSVTDNAKTMPPSHSINRAGTSRNFVPRY